MIFNGEYLKKARIEANLTQQELGQKVGITGVSIMRYEKNKRKPSVEVFKKLIEILDISPVTLAFGINQTEWDNLKPDVQTALVSSLDAFNSFENGVLIEQPIEKIVENQNNLINKITFDEIIRNIKNELNNIYDNINNAVSIMNYLNKLQYHINILSDKIQSDKMFNDTKNVSNELYESICEIYMQLNEEGQKKFYDILHDLIEIPKYKCEE